jgi:hypothetical protein
MAGQGASEVLKAAKIKGSKHVKATTFVEVIISKPYPSHNVCCCFFFLMNLKILAMIQPLEPTKIHGGST